MTSIEKLVQLGRELGYEGEDLKQFVKDEQDMERENRKFERERREAELQAEKERREMEMKMFEKQSQFEKEKFEREQREAKEKFEREQQESERQKDLVKLQYEEEFKHLREQKEKLAVELDIVKAKSVLSSTGSHNEDGTGVKVKGPCLPSFDETKDDLDAYLRRFELFAEAAKWKEENWAIILSSHLKGVALEVYSRLSQEDALNYGKVKQALMDRFECTDEGFRSRFRNAKPQRGEQVSQFTTRLKNLLLRWIELSKVPKTFEGLRDLFLSEQFLQSCGKNLQMYLKERLPLSLQEMIDTAEACARAHGGLFQNSKFSSSSMTPPVVSEKVKDNNCSGKNDSVSYNRSIKCYKCGIIGHKAVNCKQKNAKGYQANSAKVVSSAEGDSSKSSCKCKENKSDVLDLVSSAKNMQLADNLPLSTATLCGKTVEALRDTGCTTIIAKKSLIPSECFTGEERLIRMANKHIECCPVVVVDINSPFFF